MNRHLQIKSGGALRLALLAGIAISGWSSAAFGAAINASNSVSLEELIVTAQRRETRLQDTPIAVSAASGDEIRQLHLTGLGDVTVRMPSITFDRVSSTESYISIRGTTIGNDAAGIDQGVSIFIDDVPTTGFGDDNPELYDLQSVEVLRGPQGTLFGRNVTGGAILIHTLPPSFTPSARATLTYGSDNLMEAQAYATGPLIPDKLAGKVAIDLRRRDDYIDNIALHNQTGGENTGSIRGELLWTPIEQLKIVLGADFLRDTSPNYVHYTVGNVQPSLAPGLPYTPDSTAQGLNSQLNKKVGGGLLRADYSLDAGTITSITGYRNVDSTLRFSTTADPRETITSQPTVQDSALSQELRFTSPSEGKLTYIAGLFLLGSHRRYLLAKDYNPGPGTFFNVKSAQYSAPFDKTSDQHVHLTSVALYGEATYAFTSDLKLTLGGRYSEERKSGHTELIYTSGPTASFASGPYAKSWGAFTPKVLLSYQPMKDLLFYSSATQGFESGGYDANGTKPAELASAYNPEYVWSYEAGAKVTTLNRRLQLNLAIFDAEYTNLQTRNFNPVTTNTDAGNAGNARSRGAELETNFLATDWLTLGATYSYADAIYTHYATTASPNDGHKIPYTPRHTVNLRGDSHLASPIGGGTLTLGGNIAFRSSITLSDDEAAPAFIVKKTAQNGILNLHARWTSDDGNVELELWAKNLTDRRAILQNSDLSRFYLTPTEFAAHGYVSIDNWTASRLVGLSLTGKF